MLKSYLKIAARNLVKHRFYSIINIAGLAVGITCFVFILIFIQDELSYDRYHEHADRIYRLETKAKLGETELAIPEVGAPMGEKIQELFPEVETFFRLRRWGNTILRYENQSFQEGQQFFVDSTIFDVLSLKLLQGDPKTALANPNSVIITPAIAQKYFGTADPMGKTLISDGDKLQFQITGIFEPLPKQSHFRSDMLYSLSTLEESRSPQWTNMNFHTYLLLREGANPDALQAKLPDIVRTYIGSEVENLMGVTYDQLVSAGNYVEMSLFPITKIHLHSDMYDELEANSDISYVYIFSFIGLFILLIACINFMNLTTARSSARAKEVGVRKVIGALRKQLISQFLSESMIISFIALLLGIALVQLLLPYFNDLSGKELTHADVNTVGLYIGLIGLAAFVGLLAGSYPAFFLSAFRPIQVLKGILSKGAKGGWLRNGLVVFQFAITTMLIVGTLIIFDQLQYIQHKKLGFNKEQVFLLDNAYMLGNNLDAFKKEMLQQSDVESATVTYYLPTPSARNNSSYFLGRVPGNETPTQMLQNWWVDYDYISTMGMEIVEGRDFNREFGTDSLSVILNETAIKQFGITDIDNVFISNFFGPDNSPKAFKVVGIVKDFHFSSMRDKIGPLVLHFDSGNQKYLAMRVNTTDITNFISKVESRWKEMAPNQPFSYSFLDDSFNQMYEMETRIGKIIGTFAFLAIFIACIGLLGLATYTAEVRTKEIGIRKVLGASVSNLFMLLTKDFGKLILVAFVIAIPVAWYAMNRWLQGFSYATGVHWFTFAIAGFLVLLIALLTISYQSVKVAAINPVKTLKYE